MKTKMDPNQQPEENNAKPGKKKKKTQAKAPKRDLTKWYDNADAKIALKISDSTLARLRKDQKIPFTKVGNKYYYPRDYFDKSLMQKLENKHLIDNN